MSRSIRRVEATVPGGIRFSRWQKNIAMTPEHIRIIQSSWLRILPSKEALGQLFYTRLFELDPSLRDLFHEDMRSQGHKLMQLVDAAVNGLDRFQQVLPMVRELGRHHADYGVTDDHYGTVGAALLWTLGEGLGPHFTPEVKCAWTTVYGVLASNMRAAASRAKSC